MSATTSIEWTDRTWNPVTGCTKVSAGCKNCYAEGVAERFWAKQYDPVQEDVSGVIRPRRFTDVLTHEDRLLEPLSWRKPSRVFVNSMSDLFHEAVPDAFIHRVFMVMAKANQHTFQVLTKRPARMLDYLKATNPLRNVWLGVSVENQHFADERIPLLLQTPAAVRFISAEPLLGPIDIVGTICKQPVGTPALGWVIVGGESGSGARPFDLAWARSIVQQCQATGVPVFVKQLGAMPMAGRMPHPDDMFIRLKNRKGGDPSEWPDDLRIREFPQR